MTVEKQASMEFAGKTALVTGSGRNIGRAIALAFAQQGANVIVNGHSDKNAVDGVVEEIRKAGGKAIGIMADVSSHDTVASMVDQGVREFGSMDILVSNVGIRRMQPFLDISVEDWDKVLASNLSPAFYLARNAIPHMQQRKWGRIILISGFDGFWGQITQRAHNVTCKAGLHGLAKALAREFGPDGITANTVVPGAIDTVRDWSQYAHQPDKKEIEKQIPVRRFGDPAEIAAACTYLASGGGGFVSGQAIHVNGGHYMF
ncbi:3-oxoacyl-ACP reductase family protein [Noviherbaspirillum sp.]|uniref:SDR family NAD(P)-dependent oxidoreductase n=1 Tax=Noviherbaspirillum sp. TaxID=1926288 RepID=UPI002B480469|nr:3-oxoacyl-ACP reductase family protein [Noviherbaspirillum sp.]HJV79693.1 3-oxoacyl-ACP reductase family protein [Noviherbaspirillum sp.]